MAKAKTKSPRRKAVKTKIPRKAAKKAVKARRPPAGFCGVGCYNAFRSDRRHGLIYGPYQLDGVPCDEKAFHARYGTCRYCNAALSAADRAAAARRHGRR